MTLEQQYDILMCMNVVRLLARRCPNTVKVSNSIVIWNFSKRHIVSSAFISDDKEIVENVALKDMWWVCTRNSWAICALLPTDEGAKMLVKKGITKVMYMDAFGSLKGMQQLLLSGIEVTRVTAR